MINDNDRNLVINFCQQVANDITLVQGAGANVSWKQDDVLWVKASGTQLKQAANKDIFTAVSLKAIDLHLLGIERRPVIINLNADDKKPSIETILHALMPHKFVVHLHCLRTLALLLQPDYQLKLKQQLSQFQYGLVAYYKPGLELSSAIYKIIPRLNANYGLVLMKNHGIVLSANSIADLSSLLEQYLNTFTWDDLKLDATAINSLDNYETQTNNTIAQLAFHPDLLQELQHSWRITPDHVVFLGEKPQYFDSLAAFKQKAEQPEYAIIKNHGVFIRKDQVSDAMREQLQAYAEVMLRIPTAIKIAQLSLQDSQQLLNWDAEKLRKKMQNSPDKV